MALGCHLCSVHRPRKPRPSEPALEPPWEMAQREEVHPSWELSILPAPVSRACCEPQAWEHHHPQVQRRPGCGALSTQVGEERVRRSGGWLGAREHPENVLRVLVLEVRQAQVPLPLG